MLHKEEKEHLLLHEMYLIHLSILRLSNKEITFKRVEVI